MVVFKIWRSMLSANDVGIQLLKNVQASLLVYGHGIELGLNLAFLHSRKEPSTTAKGQDQLIEEANSANVNGFQILY